MKYLFYLLLVSLSIFSCQKDNLSENNVTNTEISADNSNDTISIQGTFLLISCKMYIHNLETNEKIYYNHFDNIKLKSSLNYEGSNYDIEKLEKNKTTWQFTLPNYLPGYGEFILNGDKNNPYGFYMTKSNWAIVEHPLSNTNNITVKMGGSSKPLLAHLIDKNERTVMFIIHEDYANINGYNCTYISELKFKKIN